MGQLSEKGYNMQIHNGFCMLIDRNGRFIPKVRMTLNRLFPLKIQHEKFPFLISIIPNDDWLWNMRFGHFHFSGLNYLSRKEYVSGFPVVNIPNGVSLSTNDDFSFHVNIVSGDIVIKEAPTIKHFHGGMFCDDPGLGKTVITHSLITKTQGTLADPPDGPQVVWCQHSSTKICGYYDINCNNITSCTILGKRDVFQNNEDHGYSSKRAMLLNPCQKITKPRESCYVGENKSLSLVKHVSPGQLQVYVWKDHQKPYAHSLSWDYDVVITTFSRLSAELGPHKRSSLMQVH
ncbi:hypothetical protein KIW84_023511 [Lathyrus oleraceus]|uniref:Uncharacterized protein n=1 Tax=Pisum sativum TaxID=3888 RepID=A0A9D5B6J9_PEA|nr:hypothetical protein KIW84_023511 [Pisum sativum]